MSPQEREGKRLVSSILGEDPLGLRNRPTAGDAPRLAVEAKIAMRQWERQQTNSSRSQTRTKDDTTNGPPEQA